MSSNQNNNLDSRVSKKNLNVGDKAPDFELLDTNQEVHRLSTNKEGLTILAFFPAAGSPVCTVEMCNFRDTLSSLKKDNVNIFGISVDTPFANKVFAEHHNLNFPVLSDYDKKVIEQYHVVMPSLGKLKDFKVAKRSIFIVDNNNLDIKYRWVTDNPLIEPNYEEIKAIIS